MESPTLEQIRTAEQTDLTRAWWKKLSACPYCAGLGSQPIGDGGAKCSPCDGTGDLLGRLLLDSYMVGYSDARRALSDVADVLRAHRDGGGERTIEDLKRAVGVR